MKRLTNLFPFSLAMLMLVGCSASDCATEQPEGDNLFSIEAVHPSAESRATDTGFEVGDNIGVYVTETDAMLQLGGNVINNGQFTYTSAGWSAVRKLWWNNGSYNVYAYYPWSATVNDTQDYEFRLAADQSTAEGYTQSDFMWASAEGVAASASPVRLQFSHKLSKAVVLLERGESYEGDIPADCEVYIHNTVTLASIDLSTGDASKDIYASAESIRARKVANGRYEAIVVPQNITTRRPLVEVITRGVSYLMEGTILFKPGYQTTIVVTLDKTPEQTKIEIGGSVGGWS